MPMCWSTRRRGLVCPTPGRLIPTRGVAGRSAEEFELPVPEPEGDGGLSDAGDEAGG